MISKDAIIIDKKDELYDLQKKYNVKINRSNSSDTVYIFRNYIIRVGHPISKNQKHIMNFEENITTKKVDKEIVEKVIKRFFN